MGIAKRTAASSVVGPPSSDMPGPMPTVPKYLAWMAGPPSRDEGDAAGSEDTELPGEAVPPSSVEDEAPAAGASEAEGAGACTGAGAASVREVVRLVVVSLAADALAGRAQTSTMEMAHQETLGNSCILPLLERRSNRATWLH